MDFLKVLSRIEKSLVSFIEWLGSVVFMAITSIIILQIFMRRIVNRPFVWAEDLNVLLFVWVTFMGASVLFSRKQLLNVDFFVNRLPKAFAKYISVLVDALLFGFSIYVLLLTLQFMNRQINLGNNLGGALGLPSWSITLALIFALALMIFSSFLAIIRVLMKKDTDR